MVQTPHTLGVKKISAYVQHQIQKNQKIYKNYNLDNLKAA